MSTAFDTSANTLLWPQLSNIVAHALGLHFPSQRHPDLKRGIAAAAKDLGLRDASACAQSLLTQPIDEKTLQALARHLTIGETYFFRDAAAMNALTQMVLPALIDARRALGSHRLHIWSAACCSGEEAYTLAMLLHQLLPDLDRWDIRIQGTDVNTTALQRAREAIYGDWSFRNAPSWLQQRFFERLANGRYRVIREVRERVHFEMLNLVELSDDAASSPPARPLACDLIVCRNVLMYFTPWHSARVMQALWHCLRNDGWLALGTAENAPRNRFDAQPVAGVNMFRKRPVHAPAPQPTSVVEQPIVVVPAPAPAAVDAAEPPTTTASATGITPAQQARRLADQGQHADALLWCDRWLQTDPLDAAAHYTRAVVLLEQNELACAQSALQRAVYLDSGFVLAHFALGNLATQRGHEDQAVRHFTNARRALRRYQDNEVLPESNLPASRLAQTLQALLGSEVTA